MCKKEGGSLAFPLMDSGPMRYYEAIDRSLLKKINLNSKIISPFYIAVGGPRRVKVSWEDVGFWKGFL